MKKKNEKFPYVTITLEINDPRRGIKLVREYTPVTAIENRLLAGGGAQFTIRDHGLTFLMEEA